MKLFKNGLILLTLIMVMVSCLNDDEELTGYGDAYIIVEGIGQDILMGLGLHAFSFSEFASVTASLENDPVNTYSLQPYMGYKQDFIWESPVSQYSQNLPETGKYIFNAAFNDGQSLVYYDDLYDDYIFPPEITHCTFVSADESIEIKWNSVTNADYYDVKLFDMNKNLLFYHVIYYRTATDYSFSKYTQGWNPSSFPINGQDVTVEVAAYMLEAVTLDGNLQCIAKTKENIIWGSL